MEVQLELRVLLPSGPAASIEDLHDLHEVPLEVREKVKGEPERLENSEELMTYCPRQGRGQDTREMRRKDDAYCTWSDGIDVLDIIPLWL